MMFQIQIGSGFKWVSGSIPGSRQAKKVSSIKEKILKFMFAEFSVGLGSGEASPGA
jgi:hypothetical protein